MESVQVLTHCANDTNAEFERNILEILTSLKRFDTRTKETKPNMAKARKRLAFGANEVKKYMEVGKVLGLVIATNLNDDMLLGIYTLLTIVFFISCRCGLQEMHSAFDRYPCAVLSDSKAAWAQFNCVFDIISQNWTCRNIKVGRSS